MNNQSKQAEVFLPELDLFARPPTQKSVERSYEVQYRPISSLDGSNFIDFVIPTSKDEYVLLHETYLYIKLQTEIGLDKGKEIKLADWQTLRPVNNLLHSMFKQVELEIGGKEVTMGNSTYAYRAYLETLLGFSSNAKKSHLTSVLWEELATERGQYFIPTDPTLSKSRQVDLYGRIHFDLTFQGKALLGGKDIKIKLILNDPSFYMRTTDKSEIKNISTKVVDASLYVHKMKGFPALTSAHAKALALAPVKYPIHRIDMRQVTIPKGSMDAMLDNIITGQLPRRLLLFMVPNSVISTKSTEDPFYFKHYNVNHIACFLDGVQYPANAYQPDFVNDLYMREYSGLFQAMNMNSVDSTVNLKRKDFENGKTIFAFNFAPDLSQGCGMSGHVNPIKRGGMRVHMRFGEALPEVVTVFMYCEFDNTIEIDLERNVTTDFK